VARGIGLLEGSVIPAPGRPGKAAASRLPDRDLLGPACIKEVDCAAPTCSQPETDMPPNLPCL
jgi:hypothetical protein